MGELTREKFIVTGCEENQNFDSLERYSITYWQKARKRFLENKGAIICLLFILLIILMTIIGPHLTKYKFNQEVYKSVLRNAAPSREHWFGTDGKGRDIFARMWMGARGSLFIGFTVAFINIGIGVIYGSICGYFGGLVDEVIMRIVEIVMSIPNMMMIILMSIILGSGLLNIIAAMSITGWCGVTRIIRGQIMQIKRQEYILAAEALGASSSRIISKHLVSNIIGITIVTITLEIPSVISTEMMLTFAMLIDAGSAMTWGTVGKDLGAALIVYPYQVYIPYTIISLTLICFNIVGDALADALDPKLN
ncbi:ABC transporter permease [Clostridium swellfunianum]|uniref:ABC transporter permease n=1 Tax=Clostridium swellfunianum TaxID=1367462 RepID=UPI00202EBECA|nr:ABC transporter permease [Clostridium swellfunianum]MCM0647655.1 ABC transporter permease [Clostridium swellfunianum]